MLRCALPFWDPFSSDDLPFLIILSAARSLSCWWLSLLGGLLGEDSYVSKLCLLSLGKRSISPIECFSLAYCQFSEHPTSVTNAPGRLYGPPNKKSWMSLHANEKSSPDIHAKSNS